MSKELRVYPPLTDFEQIMWDQLDAGLTPHTFPAGWFERRAKRFTDAELAADYWAWDGLCRREQYIELARGDDYTARERQGQERMFDRLNTLWRFATLPHCDED